MLYGDSTLDKLLPGSGGGGGNIHASGTLDQYAGSGGNGGGIIYVIANQITFTGSISATGNNGIAATPANSTAHGGAGSGGSVRIEGNTISLSTISVAGGANYTTGGSGRIAVYYEDTFSGSFTPGYLQKLDSADTIFNADFETANLSQWTSNVNDSGDLSASNSADYWGLYGMQAVIDDTAAIYAQNDMPDGSDVDTLPDPQTQYRTRFYFHPNSLTMATNDMLDLFTGRNGTGTEVLRVQMRKNGATYQIRTGLLNDASSWTDTSWYDISNNWTAIEIQYQAFAYIGTLTLWLDDVQKQSLNLIDNDMGTLTTVRLGAQGVDVGTNGTLYFDDFESRRFSYIGTLSDPGVNDPQPSNPAGWTTSTYQYSGTIPHAVTAIGIESGGTNTYTYDDNGNMSCRVENGVTYSHAYNAENRASSIAKRSGDCVTGTIIESWSFAYDGDGARVMTAHFTGTSGTPDSTTAYYMGGAYEVKDSAVKKYYSIAGMMVAVNDGTAVQYLLTDHLGSTVAVTNSSGTLTSQQRYLPFGGARTIPNSPIAGTDFTYTGQRMLDSGMGGIMDYKARFYSPYLNQFTQPDTIVSDPYNPQAWNRYAYALRNPIRYNDPTGHVCSDPEDENGGCGSGGNWVTKKDIKLHSLKYKITKKYNVKIKGAWDEDELSLLSDALDEIAAYAGGAENLNDIFLDGMQANGSTSDKLTFENTPGNNQPCTTGGFACWNQKDTIFLSDYIFTENYQFDPYRFRPKELGLYNNLNAGIKVTMLHEVGHVFADARPSAETVYGWRVPIPNTSSEERMVNVISYYVVSGRQTWPGSPGRFEFVREFAWLWQATP